MAAEEKEEEERMKGCKKEKTRLRCKYALMAQSQSTGAITQGHDLHSATASVVPHLHEAVPSSL